MQALLPGTHMSGAYRPILDDATIDATTATCVFLAL
jgi:hypothetical protein